MIIADINEKSRIYFSWYRISKAGKWIYNNIKNLNVKVAIGVGGSFDVMSGNVKRAPKIFIKLGLEWFYRLITQPTRIGRIDGFTFYLVVRLLIKNKIVG